MNPFGALMQPLQARPGDSIPATDARARCEKSAAAKRDRALPVVQNPWRLSPTQSFLLYGLDAGKKPKDLAAALGISRKTVWTHEERIRERMEVDTIAEAVALWNAWRART